MSQALYEDVYCQRGEAENRIKEAQVGLFATRTSCQQFQSNQLRMLLAALGYVLIERLRALALKGTKLAAAQCRCLRTRHASIALTVDCESAPGRRDDTKMARNPSRGRGHCASGAALTTQTLYNIVSTHA